MLNLDLLRSEINWTIRKQAEIYTEHHACLYVPLIWSWISWACAILPAETQHMEQRSLLHYPPVLFWYFFYGQWAPGSLASYILIPTFITVKRQLFQVLLGDIYKNRGLGFWVSTSHNSSNQVNIHAVGRPLGVPFLCSMMRCRQGTFSYTALGPL